MNPKFFRNGIVMLVLVVGTAALLFTWLQSTSTTTPVGYSQFLANVTDNKVTSVIQQGETLTVTGSTSPSTYTVTVPAPIVTKVLDDMVVAAKNGNYTLICTELCGLGHSTMRAPIVVEDQASFDKWATQAKKNQNTVGGIS